MRTEDTLNINDVKKMIHKIKSNPTTVVLFGAGMLGKLALYFLKKHDIYVSFFCDTDEQKQGKLYCGIKTISPQELSKMSPETRVFICNNHVNPVFSLLKQMNFKNIYTCLGLVENTDYSATVMDLPPSMIRRLVVFHEIACRKANNIAADTLNIKSLDVVITEACSLKCRDCANLMQYYARPRHCDLNLLLKSIEKFMKCIDWLCEFRVLGGEPFMNRQLYKIINRLLTYKNVDSIVVCTNGTIVPEGMNLSCLKNDRVTVDITDYGDLSKKHDQLIKTLTAHKIVHVTRPVDTWQDCAKILYQQRDTSELNHMFVNCCANELMTLLHGKLYRCPFSAHATNLNAIPFNDNDIIELSDENSSFGNLRAKIRRMYNNRQYLSACYYCKGRDYNCAKVDAAVQIKDPLPLSFNFNSLIKSST